MKRATSPCRTARFVRTRPCRDAISSALESPFPDTSPTARPIAFRVERNEIVVVAAHFTGRLVEAAEVQARIHRGLGRKQAALDFASDVELPTDASAFSFILIFEGALQRIDHRHDDGQHDDPARHVPVGNQRVVVESRSPPVIDEPDDGAGETARPQRTPRNHGDRQVGGRGKNRGEHGPRPPKKEKRAPRQHRTDRPLWPRVQEKKNLRPRPFGAEGSCDASHPPPRAWIKDTLATMRRVRMSTAAR